MQDGSEALKVPGIAQTGRATLRALSHATIQDCHSEHGEEFGFETLHFTQENTRDQQP
jgi:hypothetical protein